MINYYGLFMALGWLYISYDLEINHTKNNICSKDFSIETYLHWVHYLLLLDPRYFKKFLGIHGLVMHHMVHFLVYFFIFV